jgi:glycosyltransferase involved in cell wall biosynthesis
VSLKIVFPYPNYWPYVRRGVERTIHDLSGYLARRGHQVDIITAKPGRPCVVREGNLRITYHHQASHPLMFQYLPLFRLYHFGLQATTQILRNRYDALHLMSYSEIVIAPLLRRWQNLPYLFHLIVRDHWWPNRLDRWSFRQLMLKADRVAALTPKWAEHERAAYGIPVEVLPPPVDMSVFRPNGPRDLRRPAVLFTADLGDPRKGGTLLLRAWDEIHRRCPEAVLVLAGPFGLAGLHPEANANSVLGQLHLIRNPAARAAVELRGPGAVENLPRQYAQAAVTVLPSVDEAFGMVVTESLASGTPVVCSDDGGPCEIVTSREVGATVPLRELLDLLDAKRARELAEAVLYAIDLSRRPETSGRCREWAEQWSLERVGRQAETIYEALADSRRRASPPLPVVREVT